MVANLVKPTPERPALMRHHDVWIFFHEMGHIFHNLLSRTKFARFHGLKCWEPKVLEKLSSHYETQKPLSQELIEKLIKTRYVNTGLFYLQQIYLHEYDKETPGQAAFEHLLGGYDVNYYSYTWSQVFAADMYETIFKLDHLDPTWGKRYRDIILYPGGSRDEMDFLQEFLGRPTNNKAFLRQVLGTA